MRAATAVVRVGATVSLVTAIAASVLAQTTPAFERGERFRHADLELACWIPRGLGASDADGFDAGYRGHGPIPCSLAIRTSSLGFDAFKSSASGQAEYAEAFDGTVGGRRVHVFRVRNEGDERREGGYPAASAIVECGESLLVIRVLVDDEPAQVAACAMLRWIVGTLRADGADGLDACLERRRLDESSGLCFRPPRGFTADSTPVGGAVWSGTCAEPRLRARITASSADSIRAALSAATEGTKRCGRGWLLPVPGPKRDVLATERRFDDGDGTRSAVFVVADFGSRRFVVRVDGPRENREAVANVAESIAWGLAWFDVAASRDRIAAAAAALADGAGGGAADAAATLGELALFPEARQAIVAHVAAADDAPACAMLRGIVRDGVEDDACAAALVKAARVFASRKRVAPLDATLRALGTVRSIGGARVLVKHLRRVEAGTLVAALDALARYRVQRATILKGVFAAYEAESRAGRAGSYEAAQRLRTVEPAFRRALLALTGERFASVDEATAWWRANRRSIRN